MRTYKLRAHGGSWQWSNPSDYAFFVDGEAPEEFMMTGTAYYPDGIPHIGNCDEAGPDTWQCDYCGSKHWIENKELNCEKCGAPR